MKYFIVTVQVFAQGKEYGTPKIGVIGELVNTNALKHSLMTRYKNSNPEMINIC